MKKRNFISAFILGAVLSITSLSFSCHAMRKDEDLSRHTAASAAAAQVDTEAGPADGEKGRKRRVSDDADDVNRNIKQELTAVDTKNVLATTEGIGKRGSSTRESAETPHERTVRSRATQEIKNSWKHLSEEVKSMVLEYSSFQALGRVAQVSRQSKRLADDVRERRFKDPHLYTTYFENAPVPWAKLMQAAIDYVQGDKTRLIKYRASFGLNRNKINYDDDGYYELEDNSSTEPRKYIEFASNEFFIDRSHHLCWKNASGEYVLVPRIISATSYFFNESYFKAQEVLGRLPPLSQGCNLNVRNLHILPLHAFANLSGLTVLSLVGCKFGGIVPPDILKISTLKDLRLSYNGLRELPVSMFDELPGLTSLNIRTNNLREIPPSIGNATNLICLNIGANEDIRELPDSMERLRNLTSLYMFSLIKMKELPPVIGRLPNLSFLNIRENKFPRIFPVLRHMTSLTALNMYGTSVSRALDTIHMWEFIKGLPNFKRIVLDDKLLMKQGSEWGIAEISNNDAELGFKDEEHSDYVKFVD